MPEGHDTVIMQGDCRYDGNQVILPKGISRGINRRRAGEDVCKGAVILRSGQRMKAQHIGHAASISISEVEFPKIVYLIVENKIELQTKILRDYPDWQFLAQNELDRKTDEN